jgi:hypothetical protein
VGEGGGGITGVYKRKKCGEWYYLWLGGRIPGLVPGIVLLYAGAEMPRSGAPPRCRMKQRRNGLIANPGDTQSGLLNKRAKLIWFKVLDGQSLHTPIVISATMYQWKPTSRHN